MKKTIYAIAALAFAFIGCTKEYNETFAPGDKLVIRAEVNEALTKVAADNSGKFSWQAGDAITVLNTEEGKAFNLTTATAGATAAFTTDKFEGTLSEIAYYPASTSHKTDKFFLEPTFTWKDGETFMPMIGTVNTSTKKVSFKTAGAVIKLVCYNVADNARKLVVSSDTKKLSGEFTPSSGAIVAAAMGASDNTITINFAAGHPSTMVFYIPVPTGELGKLSFVVKDDSDANVSNVQTTNGNITMVRQHMVAAPAMNCSGGEILWSEDFSGYASGEVPSGSVAKGFGGANVTYACTDGGSTTKIYEQTTAGGSSPELLVSKTNGTFEVTDIPTNGASSMILKYKTNAYELTLSSPTTGISFSTDVTTTKEEHIITITNSSSVEKFGITFEATSGSNVRLDDIVLSIPSASFTAPSLSVDKDELEIDKNGGSATTNFTLKNPIAGEGDSDVKATVEEGAKWLTASISGNTLTVSADENTGAARYAKVTLRATGVSAVISVSQMSTKVKTEQLLFHESFGDNADSAREWDDSYADITGVSDVYAGITGYTITNAKQSKNTTGSIGSALTQTTKGTDAVIIIGPLAVADAEDMVLTYQWKAASVKGTYSTSLYYATSSTGAYNEVSGTGTGATSYVERKYNLPVAAQVNTLYLKIVWNTSNTNALIDEVNLSGKY